MNTCENCGNWRDCKTFEEIWINGKKTCENHVVINLFKIKQRISQIHNYL